MIWCHGDRCVKQLKDETSTQTTSVTHQRWHHKHASSPHFILTFFLPLPEEFCCDFSLTFSTFLCLCVSYKLTGRSHRSRYFYFLLAKSFENEGLMIKQEFEFVWKNRATGNPQRLRSLFLFTMGICIHLSWGILETCSFCSVRHLHCCF